MLQFLNSIKWGLCKPKSFLEADFQLISGLSPQNLLFDFCCGCVKQKLSPKMGTVLYTCTLILRQFFYVLFSSVFSCFFPHPPRGAPHFFLVRPFDITSPVSTHSAHTTRQLRRDQAGAQLSASAMPHFCQIRGLSLAMPVWKHFRWCGVW